MRRFYERWRHKLRGLSRAAAALFTAAVLLGALLAVSYGQRFVTVTDADGSTTTMLTARPADKVVHSMGAVAGYHDQVVAKPTDRGEEIVIRRAFEVDLLADGERYSVPFVEGTVADLLEACEVSLSGEDFVEPGLATPLTVGFEAAVHRVTYREETTRTELAEEQVDEYMARLFAENPASEFVKSNSGIYDATVKHTLIDGEVSDTYIEKLIPIITPRDPGSVEFIPGVPCSTIEGFEDVELGENGLPVNYTGIMEGAVCTAYSSSGGRGSSGLGLYTGTVAVNPNRIPYGTRMYITAADGSFVYGYAIATDTGTALMEGIIDLDLYFSTYGESVRFGKRQLNVYFLD